MQKTTFHSKNVNQKQKTVVSEWRVAQQRKFIIYIFYHFYHKWHDHTLNRILLIAFVVVESSAVVIGPPMFSAIARIGDAFGFGLGIATTTLTRIAFRWTFDSDRAMMVLTHGWRTMIFTMSDQRARFLIAFRRWQRHAFFARTSILDGGVARIGDASILWARASIARSVMAFRNAALAASTRIRSTVGSFAALMAVQTRTRATVRTVVPFIFASSVRRGQPVFRAWSSLLATIVAFVLVIENVIFIVAVAAGIIEWNALAA